MKKFCELNHNHTIPNFHSHSKFSTSDALCDIGESIKTTKNLGINSFALSEHGHLCSVVDLLDEAKKQGVKPIIGLEAYYVDSSEYKTKKGSQHILLIAKNDAGWQNLLKLNAYAQTEGFYAKPRINEKVLFEHQEGLIVGSACLNGIICNHLLRDEMELALFKAKLFKENIEDFYIELQPHRYNIQANANRKLIEIANKFDIPLLTTLDTHYARRDTAEAQLITHKSWIMNNPYTREKAKASKQAQAENTEFEEGFNSPDLCIKTVAEVISSYEEQDLYPEFKEEIESSIENAFKVEEKIQLDLKINVGLPSTKEAGEKKLWDMIIVGLKSKFGPNYATTHKNYLDRATSEYSLFKDKGFCDYFLILEDCINFCKKNDIMLGFARGSAGGSLVLWLIGATKIDPIRWKLPFERFMNPERESSPDVDTDVEKDKREILLDYIRKKYGENRVLSIITFSEMRAKNTIKDVAKFSGVSFQEINDLTSNISNNHYNQDTDEDEQLLIEHLQEDPNFSRFFEKYPEIYDIAKNMEGSLRNSGKHAAGIVILPDDHNKIIPVVRASDGTLLTAFEKTALEKVGAIKYDMLGLTTLNIMRGLKEQLGIDPMELEDEHLEDPEVFEFFRTSTNKFGIFQFDSSIQKKLCREIPPKTIMDLCDLTAIGRPGILNVKGQDDYKKNREKPGKISYPFRIPEVEEVLNRTNGILLYQEQVMEICQVLGQSLGFGDNLRRNFEKYGAISKRNQKVIDEINESINQLKISGAKKGIDKKEIEITCKWLLERGFYQFNKGHSCFSGDSSVVEG